MTEKSTFRLVVRAIGMASIGFSLPDLTGSALSFIGLPVRPGLTPLHVFGAGLAYLLPGLVMLVAANWIASLIYGSEN